MPCRPAPGQPAGRRRLPTRPPPGAAGEEPAAPEVEAGRPHRCRDTGRVRAGRPHGIQPVWHGGSTCLGQDAQGIHMSLDEPAQRDVGASQPHQGVEQVGPLQRVPSPLPGQGPHRRADLRGGGIVTGISGRQGERRRDRCQVAQRHAPPPVSCPSPRRQLARTKSGSSWRTEADQPRRTISPPSSSVTCAPER